MRRSSPFNGTYYRFAAPPIDPWGLRDIVRQRIPMLVAGMRPQLLKCAAAKKPTDDSESMDTEVFRPVVLPNIAEGAARPFVIPMRRTSRAKSSAVCTPTERRARARQEHLRFPIAHPVSNVVAEIEGLQDLVNELRMSMMRDALQRSRTPRRACQLFSIAGTGGVPPELDHSKGLPHLALPSSYVPPVTAEESEDSYLQIIDAFKR